MVCHDNSKYPFKGIREARKGVPPGYLEINPLYMEEARQLVLEECGPVQSYPNALLEESDHAISIEAMFFPVTKDFTYLS
jgi:hypothetical protein